MDAILESANPKVSVVVPVFNGERCLRRCLVALCRQTLPDIEIICVNDGSTDASESIAAEFAQKDHRVRLVSLPENRGVSVARNRGIAAARGEYVSFVDCDDHPALDFYEKLYAASIENGADVGKGNYRYWGLDGRSLPVDYTLNEWIRRHKTNFSFAFCSAIYRRKLLSDNDIVFPEGFIDLEDPVFSLKVALACNTIAIVDDAEINIVMNESSATFGAPNLSRIDAKFAGLSKLIDILNESSIPRESYAFTIAFWLRSITYNSIQNTTEQAFKRIRDSLDMIFAKVMSPEDCYVAFQELGVEGLFDVLSMANVAKLSEYLMQFYDRKAFAINHLQLLARAKRTMCPGTATVAIPVHTERPSSMECASLVQCLKVLGKHEVVFFGPQSLDTSVYEEITREQGVDFVYEPFPDIYFISPFTYSKLLLDTEFYSRFIRSEYMLIYQLDCWVFRDDLASWCDKGYAYIGSPWFEGYGEAKDDSPFIEPSGNGGFSLRNMEKFFKALRFWDAEILAGGLDRFAGLLNRNYEDRIIVEIFPEICPSFTIAPIQEAMRFSFEVLPERLYAMTGELPFGCHAFGKHSPDFWKQYIPPPVFVATSANVPGSTVAFARDV